MLVDDIKGMVMELELREICSTMEVLDMFKRVVDELEDREFQKREGLKTEMYKLREEYFILAGKRPYLGRPESILTVKIADLKQNREVSGNSLSNKKSGWQK